jgi:transposase
LGVAALGLIEAITAISDAITALKAELAILFDQHAQASIITSFPGLKSVLGARLLGELGDDPHRFTDARGVRSFASTAPITAPPDEAGWSAHDESATDASVTPATGGPTPR